MSSLSLRFAAGALRRSVVRSLSTTASTARVVSCSSSLPAQRFYASAAAVDDDYVSPMQDLFDAMEANGPTMLGTTTEYVDHKCLDCGVPESALRFTTTNYGPLLDAPFVHPKEHAVLLQVPVHALPLAQVELDILREIVGSRLTDKELRLTSDQFGSRIENKRHLVSMLDRIVTSCQRLAAELAKEEEQQSI